MNETHVPNMTRIQFENAEIYRGKSSELAALMNFREPNAESFEWMTRRLNCGEDNWESLRKLKACDRYSKLCELSS